MKVKGSASSAADEELKKQANANVSMSSTESKITHKLEETVSVEKRLVQTEMLLPSESNSVFHT